MHLSDRPLPPSHSFQEPVRAGREVLLLIAPDVEVQLAVPDSKPGLSSRLLPVGGSVVGGSVGSVGVPPPQVGSADWAGTLTASQAVLTALNWAQVLSMLFAAVSVQVRYFRYDELEVFISIALYMIFVAVWMPTPVRAPVPLHRVLAGCPLAGLVPSASR